MKTLTVYATVQQKVEIDPISVVEQINFISGKDWIIEKNGKYIQMTEESAGQHSFDREVGEVPKEIYDLCKAKILMLGYLNTQREKEIKEEIKRNYDSYFKKV